MPQRTYKNGLPFTGYLAKNLDDMIERVKNNKACMIVIDGQVGEGKTTLAVHIADYLQKKEIDFETFLCMGGVEFMKKLKVVFSHGYAVIIYDEAGDFNRRGSLTRFNQLINRVFETYRAFKVIVILCLPSFSVLDSQLLDKGIPRLLIHTHSRNNNNGRYSGYSLTRMYYIQEKMKKLTIKLQAYRFIHPNIYGEFLDLYPERSQSLDKFSCKGKLDILDKGEIISEGLLTYSDIAMRINRSVNWIKIRCSKLNIKAKKTHDRKKYYSQDVVDILAESIENTKGVYE